MVAPDTPLDLSPLVALRRNGLLDAHARPHEPVAAAALVPDSGLVGYLLGDPQLPAGVLIADAPRTAARVSSSSRATPS